MERMEKFRRQRLQIQLMDIMVYQKKEKEELHGGSKETIIRLEMDEVMNKFGTC
jgi:hypothetical protein